MCWTMTENGQRAKMRANYRERQEEVRSEIERRNLKEKRHLEVRIITEIRVLKALQAAYKLERLTGSKIRFK